MLVKKITPLDFPLGLVLRLALLGFLLLPLESTCHFLKPGPQLVSPQLFPVNMLSRPAPCLRAFRRGVLQKGPEIGWQSDRS